ncbi:hypothetical protein B0H19DRAFT_1062372 [Mycena capillaripes]|nr:hypothetical protein B0H19DRAFT_1062372 [Mycena capillaripes]
MAAGVPTRRRTWLCPTKRNLINYSILKAGKDDLKKKNRQALWADIYLFNFDTNPVLLIICGICKNSGKHTATAGSYGMHKILRPNNDTVGVEIGRQIQASFPILGSEAAE